MLGSAAQDGDVSEQQLEKYKKEEEEETEFQKVESIDRASGMELGVRGTGGHSPGGRGLLAQTKISLCFLLM